VPPLDFQLIRDPLVLALAIPYLLSLGIGLLIIWNRSPIGAWIVDRKRPICTLGTCYAFAAVVAFIGIPAITIFGWAARFDEANHAFGTVSGPDLIVNLLTISALVAGAGFTFLCLPSDRYEMMLASSTKDDLFASGVEPESFDRWFKSLPESSKTPVRKVISAFLTPRDGIGGWYRLRTPDFESALGLDVWQKFSRYVDGHLDDSWVRLCIFSLSQAMFMGMTCLFFRYFGFNKLVFHPAEFGVIALLLCLDFTVAYFIVSLALGAHVGLKKVREATARGIPELKLEIDSWLEDTMFREAQELVTKVDDREPGPPAKPRKRG
jgi:hypothetical protein